MKQQQQQQQQQQQVIMPSNRILGIYLGFYIKPLYIVPLLVTPIDPF